MARKPTGLEVIIDWAVNGTSAHDARAYSLAWSMFHRRCTADDADPSMIELAWVDPDIRAFWLDEAQAVIEHLDEEA